MFKRAKRQLCPPTRASENDEAAPLGLHASRKSARKSHAGSRLPRIPEQSPFDPKCKGKQQMPATEATPGQNHHHSPTSNGDTKWESWMWCSPQRQRRYRSSEAGPSVIAPSSGRLHLDSGNYDLFSPEDHEGPSQGNEAPCSRASAGPSSSAGSSAGEVGTDAPQKLQAVGHIYKPGTHPVYDQPGMQSIKEAAFCDACSCWVPSPPHNWQYHVHVDWHVRNVASHRAEDAEVDFTERYKRQDLPAVKHAAEELRLLELLSGDRHHDGVAPSLRQATRTAKDLLRANNDTTRRIMKLHKDAMTELKQHVGNNDEYQRLLATWLPIERLACVWPAVADMAPRPDGPLLVLRATPAVLACLGAQLPHVRATKLHIRLAASYGLDVAPATAALCLLVRALATDNIVTRLELDFYTYRRNLGTVTTPQSVAARDALLIGRVLPELKRTVELNTSFRWVLLTVNFKKLYVQEWAAVEATAVNAAPRQRIAVAMALHPRVGRGCPLSWLPIHIFRDIMESVVPALPCEFLLGGINDRHRFNPRR